jgi:hypothetical protein
MKKYLYLILSLVLLFNLSLVSVNAVTCSDGTVAAFSCTSCGDGGTTAISCEVCGGGSTAVPGACPAPSCPGPDGSIILDGNSKIYYSSSLVPFGTFCSSVSESRTCVAGTLTGNNNFPSCSVDTMVDLDGDGFDDVGSASKGHDDCPGEIGSFNGCEHEYTGTCVPDTGSWGAGHVGGGLRFEDGEIVCDYADSGFGFEENFVTFTSFSPVKISNLKDNLSFLPTAGSGVYTCKNLNGVSNYTTVGSCTLNSRISTPNPPLLDIDFDGVLDSIDKCPFQPSGKILYSGCASEYSLNGSCTDPSISFDGVNLKCDYYDCFFCDNDNYFNFGGTKVSSSSSTIFYTPNKGSGAYNCYNEDFGTDDYVGTCNLIHNSVSFCKNSHLTLASGQSADLYKYSHILPSEIGSSIIKSTVTCLGTTFSSFDFSTYNILDPTFLKNRYKNFERVYDGTFRKIDDEIQGKVKCNRQSSECEVKFNGSYQTIDLNLTTASYNTIKIYKDGVFDRFDEIDPLTIGLYSHVLKDFKSSSEIVTFVNNSYNLMNKFGITKNLSYGSGKTNVKIQLDNIAIDERRNLVVYQIVSKDIASNLRDLKIIDNGGGKFFVLDKDPVIGWYFNESTGNTTIEYETNGTTEGGTIIISQEAILFNDGELVVKYREVSCNTDEVNLFELDSLVDSNVYSAGSGKLFKVCISYINDENLLVSGSSLNDFNIFSYLDGGNSSDNLTMFTDIAGLGVDNTSIYWGMIIAEESPYENFSCIGSFSYLNGDSKFGDCGNNDSNRVWVHLGEDLISPTSTLFSEAISHNVPVTISAVDDIAGSGVRGIYYCVDTTNSCNPLLGTYILGDIAHFTLSCPNNWGCVKTVRFSAVDNEDNYEPIKSELVKVIDIKSSCQSDCTVKPSPNRYIAECNNLNSCDYYNFDSLGIYDNGDYVSKLCDYGVEGSYAKFNVSHDILCPSGPFRETIFGTEDLDLSGSTCDELYFYEYPLIVDKETVLMKVYSCLD